MQDPALELRPRLDGQDVGAHVLRLEVDRAGEVSPLLGQRLARHGQDQVERESVDASGAERVGGADGVRRFMDAAERPQVAVVEALRASHLTAARDEAAGWWISLPWQTRVFGLIPRDVDEHVRLRLDRSKLVT